MFSKFKAFKLMGIVCFISSFCWAIAVFSQVPQATVRLTTEPPMTQIQPFEAEAASYLGSGQYKPPVKLKLQALDAKGAPLQNTKVHLKILTPPKTPWFTTDFPVTEGTTLLDIEANTPTGEFQVQQTFPIRGSYQLQVAVNPTVKGAFVPFEQTLSLKVPENPLKYVYFWITLLVLLAIGLVGGWVIGGRKQTQPGEIAPQRVRLLLSGVTVAAIAALLFFSLSAELFHHDHAEMAETSNPSPEFMESGDLRVEIAGDKSATVGQLASLQAKLTNRQTHQPVTDAVVSITATQLENNWVAFAYQGIPDAKGMIAWQEQFFDGAPHRVDIEISPKPNAKKLFQPFQATQEIDVAGVEPPAFVRIIGLAYFTGVVALGTLLGLWLQHRRRLGLHQKLPRIPQRVA
jgi:hypothetical protein